MTTDTTTAPEVEEMPEVEEVETWPERVGLEELRDVLDHSGLRFRFEEWAHNFWLNATCEYHAARLQLRKLERMGIEPGTVEAERTRLDTVKPQVEEMAFLAAAHPEHDALDLDPLTCKYLALWLWATGGGRKYWATDGQPVPPERDVSLPLDWAAILDPELLAAFNCEA